MVTRSTSKPQVKKPKNLDIKKMRETAVRAAKENTPWLKERAKK